MYVFNIVKSRNVSLSGYHLPASHHHGQEAVVCDKCVYVEVGRFLIRFHCFFVCLPFEVVCCQYLQRFYDTERNSDFFGEWSVFVTGHSM